MSLINTETFCPCYKSGIELINFHAKRSAEESDTMDKQFEDMMRKKVEMDRLTTEKDAIAFWHNKLIEIKHEQTLAALQTKLQEIIRTMENRLSFLEREKRNL